jgi:hypothetical protein
MVTVRDLVFKVALADRATKELAGIKKQANDIKNLDTAIEASVRDKASDSLKKIGTASIATSASLGSVSSSAAAAASAAVGVGHAADKASTSLGKGASAAAAMGAGLNRAADDAARAGGKLGAFQAKLSGVERGLQMVAASTGGLSIMGSYKAADFERYIQMVEKTSEPMVAEAMKGWVSEATGVQGVARSDRAQMAAQMAASVAGSLPGVREDPTFLLDFMDQLEKTVLTGNVAKPNIKSVGDLSQYLDSFRNNVESLNDVIAGLNLRQADVEEEREKRKAAMPELQGVSDKEIDKMIAIEIATKHMTKMNAGQETIVDSTRDMKVAYEELTLTLGQALLPAFELFTKYLGMAVDLASKYPSATKWVALGIGFAFIASTAILMVGQLAGAIITLQGLGIGAGFASGAVGVLSGALGVLKLAAASAWAALGGPLIVALLVVAAVLYLVYTRTDWLQRAWKALSSVDIGGAITKGLDWAMEKWQALLDIVDSAKSRLEGVGLEQALRAAVGMVLKITLPGVLVSALGKKVPDLLAWILASIWDLQEKLRAWLMGLIPDWLSRVVDWLKESYARLKDLWDSLGNWYDQLKRILFGGYDEEGDRVDGIATKIGDVIVKALQSIPGVGGAITSATASRDVAAAKAAGMTERETMKELTGVERFRTKGHLGEVYVVEYKAKDLYADTLKGKYGSDTLSWPEFQNVPDKHKPLFEEKLVSLDIEAARARGYDIDRAKAIEKAFSGSAAQEVPVVEEQETSMEVGKVGTSAPPTGEGATEAAVMPMSSGSEGRSFTGEGTLPAGASTLRSEDVGLEEAGSSEKPGYVERAKGFFGLQEGGEVLRSGAGVIHEREEVVPAKVVKKQTIAEKLVNQLLEGHVRSRGGGTPGGLAEAISGIQPEGTGTTINLYVDGPLTSIERVDSAVDIDDLVWRLRRDLERLTLRGESQFNG